VIDRPFHQSASEARAVWNQTLVQCIALPLEGETHMLRGVILWLLGVPLIVIILLYMFVFQ
jgi:hypothetical protein